ncbi:MAG: hypothetical protein J0I47_15235 [Sphingomonas sp.]|uniref:hypothetical protein n=1 Tax=Sphingomonas sp. TaxID=28214 RepID=UPI001ACDC875|nr:hypothetical protein [Sphingomonas sp.]MBN8809572.1 hypothetical protein [Sphingomonas sp.]
MLRRLSTAIAATAIIATAAAADAPSSQTASFNVGGVAYTMPLPAGYCLPTGQLIAIAQTVAAADSANVTNLTLYRCDATPAKIGDYALVKTPANLISMTVDHATFAAQIAPEFDKPMPVSSDEISANVADNYDKVIGKRPTIGIKLATRGHDAVCGYMTGGGTVGNGTITKDIAMGACTTAIGGRVIQVICFTESKLPADQDRMMRQAKALATTIVATGGK